MTTDTNDASGIPIVIDDPAIPPMWFVAPDGFHALPVLADPDERGAAADEFVRGLFPEGDSHIWDSAGPFYAALTEVFADFGLAYSAMGVFGDDDGGIVHVSFTVGGVESSHRTPEQAVEAIALGLSRDPLTDTRRITLPCGPAVSNITIREVTIGAELTASGEEAKLLTGQIQILVPFPNAPFTAVFTLDTAAMDHWGEICDMTSLILRTVSFTDPEQTPEEVPGAGRLTTT
ncbi:hypothetical protein ACIPSE_04955 [Streptomyces sp. NPDC090106]|uniref:hypothetical protein n=1 Tax=Streptomyces sp. NPDC090106 TaxID=3365946 RepID=UPI003822568A